MGIDPATIAHLARCAERGVGHQRPPTDRGARASTPSRAACLSRPRSTTPSRGSRPCCAGRLMKRLFFNTPLFRLCLLGAKGYYLAWTALRGRRHWRTASSPPGLRTAMAHEAWATGGETDDATLGRRARRRAGRHGRRLLAGPRRLGRGHPRRASAGAGRTGGHLRARRGISIPWPTTTSCIATAHCSTSSSTSARCPGCAGARSACSSASTAELYDLAHPVDFLAFPDEPGRTSCASCGLMLRSFRKTDWSDWQDHSAAELVDRWAGARRARGDLRAALPV